MSTPSNVGLAYSTAATNVAILKELYSDDAWVMKSLVLNRNPGLALFPKDESEDGRLQAVYKLGKIGGR